MQLRAASVINTRKFWLEWILIFFSYLLVGWSFVNPLCNWRFRVYFSYNSLLEWSFMEFIKWKQHLSYWRFALIADAPKASLDDVSYALSCFLITVTTKNPETPGPAPMRLSFVEDGLELPRSLTFAAPHEGKTSFEEIPESLYCAAYLGKTCLQPRFFSWT